MNRSFRIRNIPTKRNQTPHSLIREKGKNNEPKAVSRSFNKTNETTRIPPISRASSNNKIRNSMNSRFAINQTKGMINFYYILKESYHEFMFNLPVNLIDCEFSRQFSRFQTAFECFTRQITIIYNSVNPHNFIKSLTKSSPAFQSGKTLMTEWVDFIERANRISDAGISPHISRINNDFAKLFRNLTTISTLILSDTGRTEITSQIVRRLCSNCLFVKEIVTEELDKPKSKRFNDFDIDYFERQVHNCATLTTQLFEYTMPANTFTMNDIVVVKGEVISICASISQALKAAIEFDNKIMKLKNSIISFNDELNTVENNVNLPFNVILTMQQPEDIVGDFKDLEEEAKKDKNGKSEEEEEEEADDKENDKQDNENEKQDNENDKQDNENEKEKQDNENENEKQDNENENEKQDNENENEKQQDNENENEKQDNENENEKQQNDEKEGEIKITNSDSGFFETEKSEEVFLEELNSNKDAEGNDINDIEKENKKETKNDGENENKNENDLKSDDSIVDVLVDDFLSD